MVGGYVVNGLSLQDLRADEHVQIKQLLLGDVYAGTRLRKGRFALLVGLHMPVIAFPKNAADLIVAAVADLGRSRQARACFFEEAVADIIALSAKATFGFAAVGLVLTKEFRFAGQAVDTAVRDAPKGDLIG